MKTKNLSEARCWMAAILSELVSLYQFYQSTDHSSYSFYLQSPMDDRYGISTSYLRWLWDIYLGSNCNHQMWVFSSLYIIYTYIYYIHYTLYIYYIHYIIYTLYINFCLPSSWCFSVSNPISTISSILLYHYLPTHVQTVVCLSEYSVFINDAPRVQLVSQRTSVFG